MSNYEIIRRAAKKTVAGIYKVMYTVHCEILKAAVLTIPGRCFFCGFVRFLCFMFVFIMQTLLNLSSWCLVMVERLFLAVPQGCLQFVIVVFPDHTHLLFLPISYSPVISCWKSSDLLSLFCVMFLHFVFPWVRCCI